MGLVLSQQLITGQRISSALLVASNQTPICQSNVQTRHQDRGRTSDSLFGNHSGERTGQV